MAAGTSGAKTAHLDAPPGELLKNATVPEVLRSRARETPERLAFTFLEDDGSELTLTDGELDRAASAIAARLQRAGVAGQRALLLYPPGLDYIASLFGCLYARVVAVPAYMPDPARLARSITRLESLTRDAQPRLALSTPQLLNFGESLFEESIELGAVEWIAADRHEVDAPSGAPESAPAAGELAYLQYTSGSTRTPRGVMIDHGTLVAHLQALDHALHLNGAVMSLWVPPYHDMGLVGGILAPVYWGGHAVLMSPADFIMHPHRWLEAVSRHRAGYICSPNFGFELALRKTTPEQRQALDLTCVKAAICAAEPVRSDTLRRFIDTFAPQGLPSDVVRPAYGLAEATLLVSLGRFDRNDGDGPVACGAPLEDHIVRIIDTNTGRPTPDGEVGEIWVSGPSVACGYWDKPEESRELLERRLPDEPERRYARTGDLGTLRDGQVYVTGRLKDLIVVAGRNLYPQDIELSVENADPLVRPGCVAAFAIEGESGEEVAVVAEVADPAAADTDALVAAVRRAVRQDHELDPAAVVLIAPRTLPKTSSGKVQRSACRSEYLDGTLESIVRWSREDATSAAGSSDLIDQLAQIVGTVLNTKHIDPEVNLLTLDLGSLDALRIGNALEQELGSRPELQEFLREPTLRNLAEFYEERDARRSEPTTAFERILAGLPVILGEQRRAAFRRSRPGLRAFPYDATDAPLAYPAPNGKRPLWVAFAPGSAVAMDDLGTVLAPLREVRVGVLPRFHYPSAGDLYPVQTYVHVKPGGVEGLRSGFHYHDPVGHRLVFLSPVAIEADQHLSANRAAVESCSFSLLLIADMRAVAPIYGDASKDLGLIEAGAMLQLLIDAAAESPVALLPIGGMAFEPARYDFLDDAHLLLHAAVGGRLVQSRPAPPARYEELLL